jgi:phytoene dehydrogenase-like protein
MEECGVMRVETEPRIGIDLQGPDGSTTLDGRTLIVSALWEKLNLLLLEQPRFRRLLRRFARFRPAAYPFCLHMGVHEGGLPEKMAPYVLVVPDETQAARGQNLVFLETSLSGETERAPEKRRAVTATVFLQDSPLRLSDAELRERAERILASLEGFLPFLRESIDYIHVEKSIFLSRQNQERFSRKYAARYFFHPGVHTFQPETPLRRVFLTGGMLMAGPGFEGEVLSGIHSAILAGNEVRHHE